MIFIVIDKDGSIAHRTFEGPMDRLFAWIQGQCETDIIERVQLTQLPRHEMWMDEEATLKENPVVNPTASRLIGHSIYGTVVVAGRGSHADECAIGCSTVVLRILEPT